nr:hypothetical protein [bacterium]
MPLPVTTSSKINETVHVTPPPATLEDGLTGTSDCSDSNGSPPAFVGHS